jgi:hypothetical protein
LIENSIFTIEMSLCRLVLRLKILFFLIRFIMFRLMFFGFKSEIEKLLEILKIKKRVENEPKWDSK